MIFNKDFTFHNGKNFSISFLLFSWAILFFAASEINGNFLNSANAQTCSDNLPISSVSASGNDGNVPANVLDNNLNTRWSNLGVGSWIRADLGSTKSICSVGIAWYQGNQRTSNFVIATSTDGNTFTNVFSGTSSGTTLNSEKYAFSNTNARYVRVTVNGNSVNNWASITELDIFGSSSSSNSPPVANDQAVTTDKNTAKSITLTATDPNNNPLTYTVTQPSHGTISAGTGPSRTYTPATGYVGPDSFTFKANDGIADSNTATVSITVQDTASCGTNLPISGVTASSNNGNVPSNVLDNNLNTRWSNNPGLPAYITADLGTSKTICSVDIAWYLGNQRFYTFTISTSTTGSTGPFTNVFSGTSSGTTVNSEKYSFASTSARYVRITVTASPQTSNQYGSMTELDIFGSSSSSNSPPVANDQAVTTDKNTAKSITLTATDPNNNPLNCVIVSGPSQGTIPPTGPCNVARTYTPTTGYAGPDSFTFKANDGILDSNIATVNINVIEPSSCATNLPISGVTASSNNGNVPSNVLDNNLNTRWSNNPGLPAYITADLGTSKTICEVDIAWYLGNQRVYTFTISTSTTGSTFTNVLTNQQSSGATVNSEKYSFASTSARYVRITVTASPQTSNQFGSMTELDIFGSGDQFGIKKLYQSKSGGEEWFMNMNNPLGDSRFNPQNTITKNPDGSWKMKSTQVRMSVYTSTGYDSNDIPTLDHSVIASKGYMLAPNDWRNFEMTQYVKVNTSPSDDNFSPNGRGGRHTLVDTPPVGCEGSSTKGDVFFSGQVRFAKEQWHVSYVFTNVKTATSSIEDKWVGIKFIVYNFLENNKVVVKTELWLDTNNNGNFVKVDENVDRGGWGTTGGDCGGAPDQIITWGGPITTFRWDTATDVDFKNLSVREIIPP